MPSPRVIAKGDVAYPSNYGLVNGLIKGANKRVWVGGLHDIYQLDISTGRFSLIIENQTFQHSVALRDGSMLIGGPWQSTCVFDGNDITELKQLKGEARDFSMDTNGDITVANYTSVFEIDENQILNNKETLISSYEVPKICSYKDRSGILWIGTNGNGIIKYNPAKLNFRHGLSGKSISDIYIAPDSSVFFYRDQSGFVFDLANKSINLKDFGIKYKLKFIDDFLVTENGLVVTKGNFNFGSNNYRFVINVFDPTTQKTRMLHIPWYLESFKFIEGKNGDIWIQSLEGVIVRFNYRSMEIEAFDVQSNSRLTSDHLPQFRGNQLCTAIHYVEDVLWLGYESGIYKCELDTKTNNLLRMKRYKNIINDNKSLNNNHVTSFMNDPLYPNKYLWISTRGGGINRFNLETETFESVTTKEGLPNDVVYGILSDTEANIWGSTNNGLFALTFEKSTTDDLKYRIRNFNPADGLQESEFNTNAYAKLPDGRLAFAGVNGVNVFDPKSILTEEFQPPVFITKLIVDGKEVLPQDDSKLIEKDILFTKEIELTHLQDILTIEFASLDFNNPEKNKYRYKLRPLDKDWHEAGSIRSATYLHLPDDSYTFELQGSNNHGIWSDKTAHLKITVLPPWWFTGWAYLAYILLLAYLMWQYYKFITKRTELNQQLIFEKNEAEKAKELDHLKTRLYTNLTHEFRTPLTIIIGMVDQIKGSAERNVNDGLDMIKRNGENLLLLVNKMLDLSKIESGKMVLDSRQGNIIKTLKNVTESLVGYAANKDIIIHFLSDLDEKNMMYDDEKVRHILSNLISNSIKFTPAGGNIYITVRQQDENLALRVKDTGRGIGIQQQDKIFDRFYQIESEDNRTTEGTGIGLALCKELVYLMNGQISVQSPPRGSDRGSEFIVLLPISGTTKDLNSTERSFHTIQTVASTNDVPSQTGAIKATYLEEKGTDELKENKKVILLVEDNADIVAYVASCLKKYKLIVATNGIEGLEMAIEAIPDLIVSDVMMPIMDGLEMCERIKKDTRTNHIPVVMLTAKADNESKIIGLEYGANAYISKPFDKEELTLTIRNLFNLRKQLQKHFRMGSTEDVGENTETDKELEFSLKLDDFVLKVKDKIENRIDDSRFSVEDLAHEMHFSQSQLSRKLNALIGITPVKFIRQIRLNKAKIMLDNPKLSITEISYDCGFSDPSYFSRVFKKEFGMSPIDWRERK